MSAPANKHVAVIGAGVSGVITAAHLLAEGVDVSVFEKQPVPGGVWVWDPKLPREPTYPSAKPSVAETAFFDSATNGDLNDSFTQPGPAYDSLQNNVPTELLEVTLNPLKPGTPSFVGHKVLKDYIQDTAEKTGVTKKTHFNTKVNRITKEGEKWKLNTTTRDRTGQTHNDWYFDAVVVASGHYNAPNIPDIPALAEWKKKFPSRIQHSKSYRNSKGFENQTVLVIGGAASSADAAKEVAPVAKKVYQSTRDSPFDFPAAAMPKEIERVKQVVSFGSLENSSPDGPIGSATTVDGTVLNNIDRVILATGYQFSLPFVPELHRDDLSPTEADEKVIVTDGTQLHNLHKDIFYIPDPTLAFIGVPFYTATFSLFEFQAIAAAAVLSGKTKLPSKEEQRAEYDERIKEKGYGRKFHSRYGEDLGYAASLMSWVNEGREPSEKKPDGYSEEWVATRERLKLNPHPKNALFDKKANQHLYKSLERGLEGGLESAIQETAEGPVEVAA